MSGMKNNYKFLPVIFIIIILIQSCAIFLKKTESGVPEEEPGLQLRLDDRNQDGKTDSWLYRDKDGMAVKWIYDSDFDSRPDHWSYIKDGRGFLSEADTDHDGKVDRINITIFDYNNTRGRSLSFSVQNNETNVFAPQEDTGWISDDSDLILK